MSDATHFGERLQDFLDGRLADAERAQLEAHLSGCTQCQRELEALRWVQTEALGRLSAEPVPEALVARVRANLDAEDARAKQVSPRRSLPWAALVGGGLAAAAALVLLLFGRSAPRELPELVARDFGAFAEGRLNLGVTASEPQAIEAYFAQNGVPFATRVFDLGMMQYALLGGRVHRLSGRTSAFFVYRGADGRLLVCQMYEGRIDELPVAVETRELNGFRFQVYREGNTTVVFWQEGDVVCVLASDAPYESVIQLAAAKAMKPS